MKIKNQLCYLSAIFAVALTFSCSDGGDDGEGGNGSTVESIKLTEVYTIKEKDGTSFIYASAPEGYNCWEGGKVEEDDSENKETIIYSINNNIMSWEHKNGEDTLNFKGNSNALIGTWTRTKNRDASCELTTETFDDGETGTYYYCKSDWKTTKLDFTETTITITRDYCLTDTEINGENSDGVKVRIIDCNSAELSKGSEKIIVKAIKGGANKINLSYNYKGKTCTRKSLSESTKSEYQTACKKAWDEYGETEVEWQDNIHKFLNEDFNKCIRDKFPAGFLGEE